MQHTIKLKSEQEKRIIERIRKLPTERIAEVLNFVEFLSQKEYQDGLGQAATRLSEDAFQKIWDNPEDSAYDNL